jgi:hypothetical protein
LEEFDYFMEIKRGGRNPKKWREIRAQTSLF